METSRATPLMLMALLCSCATQVGPDGLTRTPVRSLPISQERDRPGDRCHRAEVSAGLRRIAEKLYKRNPREWKKAGLPSLEAALERLFAGRLDFAGLKAGGAAPPRSMHSVRAIREIAFW